ncbi:MAG: hypothetical protein KAT49_03495 [Methanomicrobia archaeon]|nr:hypothetical protein [Methanomicrobia archaeon]MCK4636926.1 hypothetical protein [Methanomicrobia archaeon]
MKDVIVGDIVEILQKLQERKKEIIKEVKSVSDYYQKQEEQKTVVRQHYEKFSHVEELQGYYTHVMFCRLIFLDIKNRTTYLKKMEKYCEGIQNLKLEEIRNVRYNDEFQEYVILSDNGERYEIYEDNLRFIYPMFFKIQEANIAFDGEKFIVYNIDE